MKLRNKNWIKVFLLLFKNTLSSFKTYVYVYLFSSILCFLLIYIWLNYSLYILLPPQLISFLALPFIIAPLYVSLNLIEWKKRNYLIKINFGLITKINLLISLILISLILATSSFIINLFLNWILTISHVFQYNYVLLGNIEAIIWLFVILNLIFETIFISCLFFALTSMTSKTVINILIILSLFIFMITTSGLIIPPHSLSGNVVYESLGYINPFKYFNWTNLLFSSYQFVDKYGITQILPDYKEGDWISFKGIYITIPFEIVFVVSAFYFYKYYFRIGVKK
ncbi:hypothetical protein SFLOR_v1c01820 [Spiroplasma floricola 23-6]|uniref:Uncharacterized protein n=1 Tax=Spiroplasma floricola 23-6 TaxID=1336749 RepID=A0A2K8SCS7_9MOLU|nr:hypothetical protein SFLOR_v1c01820 [Spiroplasma floricola 23-6]